MLHNQNIKQLVLIESYYKKKRLTVLISHLSNCSMAFAMYIHVQYGYRANEIVFVALLCSGFICLSVKCS